MPQNFDWWKDQNLKFHSGTDQNTRQNIDSYLSGQQVSNPTDSFNQWQTSNEDFWNNAGGSTKQQIGGYLAGQGYENWEPSGMAVDFSGLGPAYSTSSSSSSGGGQSHSGLSQLGINNITPLLGTGEGSLPSLIDKWAQDTMKNYRVDARDITNTLNQVANRRAAQGIMGGTEAENLRANMMTNLIQPTLQNRAQVMGQAAQLKSNAIPTLLSLLNETNQSSSNSSSTQSYQQSPQDYAILAQMINQNW